MSSVYEAEYKTEHWVYNDGGRSNYFTGKGVGDCVTRAVVIASGIDYKKVYDTFAKLQRARGMSTSARNGVYTKSKSFKDTMRELGFRWVATMQIGSGCQTHLRADELPKGRIVCVCSRHYVAVIDGIINDTYDSSRNGNRCVYGYWIYTEEI
jgi:hypothetical protein